MDANGNVHGMNKPRPVPFVDEFRRYVPAGMSPEDIMKVINGYGLANDTVDFNESDDNREGWNIKISLESLR